MTALQGCKSRSQLEVAYAILLKHLLVAQQTVSKYEAQYKNTEMPLSPISTIPELNDNFDNLDGIDNHMRSMLQRIPHHQSHLTPTAQAAVYQGHLWDMIHPTLLLPSDSQAQSQVSPSFAPFKPDTPHQSNIEGKKKVELKEASPWNERSSIVENPHNELNPIHSSDASPFKRAPPPDDDPSGGGGGGSRGGGGGIGGNGFPPVDNLMTTTMLLILEVTTTWEEVVATQEEEGAEEDPHSLETRWDRPLQLKVEQLPEWDGNHWTAIDYFWEVQQLAHLGGWIPEALGYWLWFCLKDKWQVKSWFIMLPLTYQSYMRSQYLKFLKGIKDGYLGHRWQLRMNNYYNSQIF
ncbi:hypothetical protein K443DRAFT_126013 [Laccaria amethystina LaAM-08-1]|uniref:Uncharacterized protein n=1 Tax=Laccaria amethystina LaAM-08-1 TaxID=1095629 RepID=A0A0C9X3B2_9AGAR|nr:hypothetical protein K443DRAFT_126013 [Laccaria amethystina LaAM-08-1]